MNIYLPEKLCLAGIIKNNSPANIPNFKESKLALLLSQIIAVAANNKKIMDADGYVPLSSKILQKLVREYRQYLGFAKESGIILEKPQFIRGEKCRRFKFHPKYDSKIVLYNAVGYRIPKCAIQNSTNNIVLPKKNKFLADPFISGNLTISYLSAKDLIIRQHKYYLEHPDNVPTIRVKGLKVRKTKNPFDILNTSIYTLDRLQAQEYHMSIDKTGGRCHTNLTNMPSLLRNYLRYRNEYLVSIDVSNSQPYLINVLLNSNFYCENIFSKKDQFFKQKFFNKGIKRGIDEGLNIYSLSGGLGRKVIRNISDANSIFTLVNQGQTLTSKEIQRYSKLTTTGALYTQFQQGLIKTGFTQFNHINNVKIEVLRMFYSSNKHTDPAKEWFATHYKTIYDISCFFKKYDKTLFPILLQRIESEIMLNRVARRIHREKPWLPIFTVHDSIITTVGNENYVAEVMKEEFTKCIGLPPHLKYEYYQPDSSKILNLPY